MCHACVRDNNRFNAYGITSEEFLAKRTTQNFRCAICRKHETEVKRPGPGGHYGLVVDHCHATDQLRDLLCTRCNAMVGYCDENPQILAAMIDYLNKWRR